MLCERLRDVFARQLVRRLPSDRDWKKLSEWLRSIASAVLIASVVHLLHSFHLPLELPTHSLAVNIADHVRSGGAVEDPLNDVAIVHLDLERFRSDLYKATSPLDRCALAKDLRVLLDNRDIETVAVDFFLSPTYRVTKEEKDCQKKLDGVLDQNPGRVIAIRRENDGDRNKDWFRARSGMEFGHSDLDNEFGMVRNHIVVSSELPAFADVVAARLCRKTMPDAVMKKRCTGLPRKDAEATAHPEEPRSHPIVFRNLGRFYREGDALRLDDRCLVRKAEACPPSVTCSWVRNSARTMSS